MSTDLLISWATNRTIDAENTTLYDVEPVVVLVHPADGTMPYKIRILAVSSWRAGADLFQQVAPVHIERVIAKVQSVFGLRDHAISVDWRWARTGAGDAVMNDASFYEMPPQVRSLPMGRVPGQDGDSWYAERPCKECGSTGGHKDTCNVGWAALTAGRLRQLGG